MCPPDGHHCHKVEVVDLYGSQLGVFFSHKIMQTHRPVDCTDVLFNVTFVNTEGIEVAAQVYPPESHGFGVVRLKLNRLGPLFQTY